MRESSKIYAALVAIFLIYSYPSFLYGSGSASENYSAPTSVFSGGGGFMSSDTYGANGTLGQPSPLMETDYPPYSSNYSLYPGYWYTLEAVIDCEDLATFATCFGHEAGDTEYNPGCDSDGDGDIDGIDLAEFGSDYPM